MIISLKNIVKDYGKEASLVKALNDLSLDIEEGEFIAIMGPSGCGKSTLLNVIGCIDNVTSGEYIFKGKNINKTNINKLSEIRSENISFIFQNFALIKEFTVLENIMLPLKFKSKNKANKEYIEECINMLGIETIKNKKVNKLSGGQQQRVAIARALVQETDVILADEPTGALDQENSKNIMEILTELNRKFNKTIIVVTHDSNVVKYCSRIINIKDGKIE